MTIKTGLQKILDIPIREYPKKMKKFVAVGITLTSIIGAIAGINYLAKPANIQEGSQIYQGYHNNKEDGKLGSRIYAFDPLTLGGRGDKPAQYLLEGDFELANNILHPDSMGKKYKIVYGQPKNPFMGPQLVSVERDTSTNQ